MPSISPPKGFGKSSILEPIFGNPVSKFRVDVVDISIAIVAADGIDLMGDYPIFSLNHCQSNIRRGVMSHAPFAGLRASVKYSQLACASVKLVWREIRQDYRAKVFEVFLGSGALLGNLPSKLSWKKNKSIR